jgi:hypothetical protein
MNRLWTNSVRESQTILAALFRLPSLSHVWDDVIQPLTAQEPNAENERPYTAIGAAGRGHGTSAPQPQSRCAKLPRLCLAATVPDLGVDAEQSERLAVKAALKILIEQSVKHRAPG